MVPYRLQRWLRQIVNPANKKTEFQRRSFRPCLESLENRDLLTGFLVTSTANAGTGTLHAAILAANANPGPDSIFFDIGAGGNQTIVLTSPLPTLADTVTIDGTSQAGWNSSPIITVDGVLISADGLTTTADGCKIKGLALNNFANNGISIYSNNNVVSGNSLVGNFNGVVIANAVSGNVIGGTTVRGRNLISGNFTGIKITERSTNNIVQGNYIGTASNGFIANANDQGISIQEGASNNLIGGAAAGAGNLISGNSNVGIYIDIDVTGTQVQGNKIGTNADGSIPLANGTGIRINGSTNTVGGTAAGAGNLISGSNTSAGIILGSTGSGNKVQGNKIGTDVTGTIALSNNTGIDIQGSNNTVGGTVAGAGNLISGNADTGIFVESTGSGNQMQGNMIGINAAGTAAIANDIGVDIHGPNNMVGGTVAGAGNIISGNSYGIFTTGTSSGNLMQGNKIGTNSAGSAALPNTAFGIEIFGSNNTVGGTAVTAGNLISGNTLGGIDIGGSGSVNLMQGNKIGTNAAGTGVLANGGYGIRILTSNNTVGGTIAGAGNLISGNTTGGIFIGGIASGNLMQGNKIGTNAAGTAAVANGGNGVQIQASNNTVGGTAVGAGNIIAFNLGFGVGVYSGIGNAIKRNSIFGNVAGGILNPNQAAPTLTGLATFNAITHVMTIHGTQTGAASSHFTLEFFANPVGQSQGKIFLGSFVVTTNAAGTVTFTATITITAATFSSITTPMITATATNPTGDTSRFSNAIHDPVLPAPKAKPAPPPPPVRRTLFGWGNW